MAKIESLKTRASAFDERMLAQIEEHMGTMRDRASDGLVSAVVVLAVYKDGSNSVWSSPFDDTLKMVGLLEFAKHTVMASYDEQPVRDDG